MQQLFKSVALDDPQGPWVVHTMGSRGDWVVCWPTVLSDHRSFLEFARNIAHRHRVLLIDPPGYAANYSRSASPALVELMTLTLRSLDQLGIRNFHWVGMGRGGHLGLLTLHKCPERFLSATFTSMPLIRAARVSLFGGVVHRIMVRSAWGRDKLVAHICKQMTAGHPREFDAVFAHVRQVVSECNPQVLAELQPAPQQLLNGLRQVLTRVNVPTLFIAGEHDRFTKLHDTQTAAQLAQQGRFVSLPCGFMTTLLQPQACADAFLGRSINVADPSEAPTAIAELREQD